jgi:hypothetical protein
MSKHDIQSVFHVEQLVTVINELSNFYQQVGVVERIGAAGSITYVHVRIGSIVMTFDERELSAVK